MTPQEMGVAIRLKAPLGDGKFVARRMAILDTISSSLPIILHRSFDESTKYVSLRMMVSPK